MGLIKTAIGAAAVYGVASKVSKTYEHREQMRYNNARQNSNSNYNAGWDPSTQQQQGPPPPPPQQSRRRRSGGEQQEQQQRAMMLEDRDRDREYSYDNSYRGNSGVEKGGMRDEYYYNGGSGQKGAMTVYEPQQSGRYSEEDLPRYSAKGSGPYQHQSYCNGTCGGRCQ